MGKKIVYRGCEVDSENIVVVADGTWTIEVVRANKEHHLPLDANSPGDPTVFNLRTDTINLQEMEDGVVMAYDYQEPYFENKLYVWESHYWLISV